MSGSKKTAQESQFLAAYETYSDVIFRRCFFKTSSREVALELAQETFTRSWEHLVSGKEIQNYKAFLFTVANRCIIDYYKKKRPRYEHEFSEEDVEKLFDVPVDGGQELHAEWQEVMRCFKQLESKYREIMLLRYTEGWAVEEIAEHLKERANTVSVWISRSIQRLRTCLGVTNATA